MPHGASSWPKLVAACITAIPYSFLIVCFYWAVIDGIINMMMGDGSRIYWLMVRKKQFVSAPSVTMIIFPSSFWCGWGCTKSSLETHGSYWINIMHLYNCTHLPVHSSFFHQLLNLLPYDFFFLVRIYWFTCHLLEHKTSDGHYLLHD